MEIILKKIIIFLLLIFPVTVSSCKERIRVEGVESKEDYNNLSLFLSSLPKTQMPSVQSPYNEITTFLKGREEVLSEKYREGFETLARFLYTYPSSYYESEATYLLGQSVMYMLVTDPEYISEFYNKLNKEGIVEGETIAENIDESDTQTEKFSINEIYDKLGIKKNDGVYYFNGAPFSRIVRDSGSTFHLKDFAYYFSIKNKFISINKEEDKNSFMTNVGLLEQFSDRYRTSVLQESILDDKRYFPDYLPFQLTSVERKEYRDVLDTVRERISYIKPDIDESAYVIGNGVIIRDRIPSITTGTEKELHRLYNYDFVTVLKKTNVYNKKSKQDEDWVLVRYNTYYGPIVGWSYAQYITNDASLKDIFNNYKMAMIAYNNYDYLKASDFFSYILSYSNTNYFTDKSAYFLWKVNNKIGELVSSKGSPYYKYVKDYPKYFYYNTNSSVLQSSTLLYNYLIKIMPNSPYRFVISDDSDMEYGVE